ncbi:hypothetical protein Dimus_012003 [Dionaea muscipula]
MWFEACQWVVSVRYWSSHCMELEFDERTRWLLEDTAGWSQEVALAGTVACCNMEEENIAIEVVEVCTEANCRLN